MPGPLLHVGALLTCPHQAPIQAVSSSRVLLNGMPALAITNVPVVAGCPFTVPGPKPQPCIKVLMIPAAKVLLDGQPAAILTPGTLCQSPEQLPQGPPNSAGTQTRVAAL